MMPPELQDLAFCDEFHLQLCIYPGIFQTIGQWLHSLQAKEAGAYSLSP